ncbi:uncharacterized protein LOC100901317 [Galendromus occidentalis]|uniref:Uncharacterized protein LOC100901317 n=1 Tax=Galendromus occidentalis TaxID=34638 RepID=A0AAJ6QWW3_9ACAR|nr:uncharacterized protein LOC100901317 [Galendromus occidentalis]
MTSLATRVLRRSITTSSRLCAKPGYFIYKLLEKEAYVEKRAKYWAKRGPQIAHVVPPENSRRQSVLNALYMETVTDILGSEFATELEQYSIQIHNVRILPTLDVVNVYWSCDESGLVNPEAAKTLKDLEPKIRRELSSVRHMGIIPKVNFVFYAGTAKSYSVHSILDKLRASGELDDVEPAPLPVKTYPQVYGLNREKILQLLATRSLPADFLSPTATEIPSDRTTQDFVRQFRRSRLGFRDVSRRRGEAEQLEFGFRREKGEESDDDFHEGDEEEDQWDDSEWSNEPAVDDEDIR